MCKRNIKFFIILTAIFTFGCLAVVSVKAQDEDKLMLTITPPLIKINLNEGETWQSSVKIVNNNNRPITVYAAAQDFKSGEDGGVVFLAPGSGTAGGSQRFLLSQWLEVSPEPITIPAQDSMAVPFKIAVPAGAEPGGHYAAILVGTRPAEGGTAGVGIKVASQLASLLMLNVKGEVIERGEIREFSLPQSVYREPAVDFTVRFENTGNVHLQPQGEIAIYDMFNKEKDRITINHETEFGNVLPDSTRKWRFSWEGEGGILGMGRYRAELVLSYGETARETVNRALYFWIVNFRVVGAILGVAAFIVFLLILSIRFYIRRAIFVSQQSAGLIMPRLKPRPAKISVIPGSNGDNGRGTEVKPKKAARVKAGRDRSSWSFWQKWLAVGGVLLALAAAGAVIVSGRAFPRPSELSPAGEEGSLFIPEEVPSPVEETQEEMPDDLTVSTGSPEILATTAPAEIAAPEPAIATSAAPVTAPDIAAIDRDIRIRVLNGSGVPGSAQKVAGELGAKGYNNITTGNADSFNYPTTIIRYLGRYEREADDIKEALGLVVEMQTVEEQAESIVVIAGKDIQ